MKATGENIRKVKEAVSNNRRSLVSGFSRIDGADTNLRSMFELGLSEIYSPISKSEIVDYRLEEVRSEVAKKVYDHLYGKE